MEVKLVLCIEKIVLRTSDKNVLFKRTQSKWKVRQEGLTSSQKRRAIDVRHLNNGVEFCGSLTSTQYLGHKPRGPTALGVIRTTADETCITHGLSFIPKY